MASSIDASTSGAGGVITTADNTGILNLQTASTTAVTINASQNVGIGTTSPGSKLDISGSTNSDIYKLRSNQTAPTSTDAFIYRPADNTIALGTSSTERMRIDSSGNVLVGTTSTSGLYNGGSTNIGYLISKPSIQTQSNNDNNIYMSKASGYTDNTYVSFWVAGSMVGKITTTGSATTYVTSSDYRLKENIVPMIGALDKVALLKPVTYTWKIDGSDGQGFIAHELQAVVPDAVVGEKDAVDEEGNIKPQGIDTSFLVATLTAAIQEQQTIINDLKARVTALEAK